MGREDDREGREPDVFTQEEERIHRDGIRLIQEGLERGLGFDEACGYLRVSDPEMRRMIVDDYLKVTIAERHFQGKASTETVARELGILTERVEKARAEMLEEVGAAAAEAFRRQSGERNWPPSGDSG